MKKVLFHYSILKKGIAETHRLFLDIYGEHVSLNTTCKELFILFINGNLELVSENTRKGEPNNLKTLRAQTHKHWRSLSTMTNMFETIFERITNRRDNIDEKLILLHGNESRTL